MTRKCIQPFMIAGIFLSAVLLSAQDTKVPVATTPAADESDILIKATQNPVASLISVPLQNFSNFAVGPYNRTQDVFNIEPVIPIRISETGFSSLASSNPSSGNLHPLRTPAASLASAT